MAKSQKEKPYVVIVGCGKVGEKILDRLYHEDFLIAVIDNNAERVNDLVNQYDILGIVGNGASEEALNDANIMNADLFVAVSKSDEFNLLCCSLVKAIKGIPTIARVRTPVYNDSLHLLKTALGIKLIINPELEAAKEAARILSLPIADDVTLIGGGKAEIVRFTLPDNCNHLNETISQIDNDIPGSFIIPVVNRPNDGIQIPRGDFVLKAGDHISLIAPKKVVRYFFKKMKIDNPKVKNCMIIGGGYCSFFLARELIRNKIAVKIIERDKKRCEQLTEVLPEAIIINGDGANEGLLIEEGLEDSQAFVPFTGIDEENIILALHAKANSNAKIITKLDRGSFHETIANLNAGTTLFPSNITTEAIVAYARAMKSASGSKIQALYHMYDDQVEVLEFLIDNSTKATDIPLKDLSLKKGTVVGFIRRGDTFIVPKGNDCIKQGDTVMVITRIPGFKDIDDILDK